MLLKGDQVGKDPPGARGGGAVVEQTHPSQESVDGNSQRCNPHQLKDLEAHEHPEGQHVPPLVQHNPMALHSLCPRVPVSLMATLTTFLTSCRVLLQPNWLPLRPALRL